MKSLNGRTLPRISDACNFCFIFYTNPALGEPFDAFPEIVGIDLSPVSGDHTLHVVRASRLYNSGPSGYFASGVSFRSAKNGMSQFAAAELLNENSPLVVPNEFMQAVICNTLVKFGMAGYTVITSNTLCELVGVDPPEPFVNSLQMREFFREVAVSYF